MQKLLIQNAKIINPAGDAKTADILIGSGKILDIAPGIECGAPRLDADGLFAAPGFVDMHVHLRDPGQTQKEDIFTGCAAAAAGGFTSLAAMPNTSPVVDSAETVEYIREKAETAKARVYPVAAISKGMRGEQLTDFAVLKKAGAAALSDDGRPVVPAALMLECMRAADLLDMPVLSHCEDDSLSQGGLIHDGSVSRALGVKGIPAAAEDVMIAREIALSAASSRAVHICHVSTATGVALIRDAKRRGLKVSAETAPHYFTLTDQELRARDANFRMNPPLREQMDVEGVIEGLRDGTIDAIATDHAPHTPAEKADFLKAPNGIIGLETAFALGFTKLVLPGHIDLARLVSLMSVNPARLLRIDAGDLSVGKPADIVLFSEETWRVDKSAFHSRARNTPFDGMKLSGRVKFTVCRGKIVYR